MRASVSLKTVTEHLQALESDGYVRSGTRPGRAGQSTHRWVNMSRIHEESESRQTEYRSRRASVDSSPANPVEQVKLGREQVNLTDGAGEAASLVTVIEPSVAYKKRQHARNPLIPKWVWDYPPSDAIYEREPDALCEVWLWLEAGVKFGWRSVEAAKKRFGDMFFVWRKAKDAWDEHGKLPLWQCLQEATEEFARERRDAAERDAIYAGAGGG